MHFNPGTGLLLTDAKEVPYFNELVAFLRATYQTENINQVAKVLVVDLRPSTLAEDLDIHKELMAISMLVCALRCTDIDITKMVNTACKNLSHEDQNFVRDLAKLVESSRQNR